MCWILEFKKYFEVPIVASNQPQCSEEIKKLGEVRSQELNHKTNSFILRRTQSIIDQYLPSKQECVIFCSPTHFQVGFQIIWISFPPRIDRFLIVEVCSLCDTVVLVVGFVGFVSVFFLYRAERTYVRSKNYSSLH